MQFIPAEGSESDKMFALPKEFSCSLRHSASITIDSETDTREELFIVSTFSAKSLLDAQLV